MPSLSIKRAVRSLAAPVGAGLARLGISANAVTLFGLILAAACGFFLSRGNYGAGLACLLASSLCDLLDGAVARSRGRTGSPFGAALDSVVDRYGEAMILTGVLYVNPESTDTHEILNTCERPLNSLGEEDLCPGSEALWEINEGHR